MNKRIAATLAGAAIAAASLTGCQNFVKNEPVTCTVTDKDRSTASTESGSKSVFRIYTEGGDRCGTFGLADNPFAGNWNSADIYGRIKVGATYELETVGTRNGFMSWFPEITKATEVKP